MSFCFGFRRPKAAAPFGILMLRAAKPPLRRGFACGKTLERRKSGAAQKGRWARCRKPIENLKYLDCSDLPKQKDIRKDVLLFWAPTAEGGLHPLEFECSEWQSHPCAKIFAFSENARTPQKRRGPERPLGDLQDSR